MGISENKLIIKSAANNDNFYFVLSNLVLLIYTQYWYWYFYLYWSLMYWYWYMHVCACTHAVFSTDCSLLDR